MSSGVLDQAHTLLQALAVGFALGLVYDCLRPFRLRAGTALSYLLDLLYCFILTLVIFLCAPLFGRGYVRIFFLIIYALGAWVYFLLFSRPMRTICAMVDSFFFRLSDFLLWPFYKINAVLTAALSIFFLRMQKSAKNIFSFWRKWFKMKKMLKRSKGLQSLTQDEEEGDAYVRNQKGWSGD